MNRILRVQALRLEMARKSVENGLREHDRLMAEFRRVQEYLTRGRDE